MIGRHMLALLNRSLLLACENVCQRDLTTLAERNFIYSLYCTGYIDLRPFIYHVLLGVNLITRCCENGFDLGTFSAKEQCSEDLLFKLKLLDEVLIICSKVQQKCSIITQCLVIYFRLRTAVWNVLVLSAAVIK